MKKELKIYRITFKDDGTTYYFKGIDDLRDFAISRIEDGWDTDVTEEDLKDDNKVIEFIESDYGEKLDIIMTITEDDLINI